MNFSQLQSFVALVDTGSFTDAAETVHLTQSAVSRALINLERELGVTLIDRNRNGVVALTAVGGQILPHVRALLAQVEAIEQEAKAARGKTSGKLRLGSTHSIVSPYVLATLLTRFQSLYPDIDVVLFEGGLHEVVEWIESGVVDVGFVLMPAPGIEGAVIGIDELCVIVPKGHRLESKGSVSPDDLRDEQFVLDRTHCALQLLDQAVFSGSGTKPDVRYRASDRETILAMVNEGLGITVVPRQLLPKERTGIVALRLDPPHELRLGLAVNSYETAPRGARLLIETAQALARHSV